MNELEKVANLLNESVVPMVGSLVFPNTMTITSETVAAGSGGGRVKSATTDLVTDVPCKYDAMQVETRVNHADRLISIQQYMFTFPMYLNGERITPTTASKFVVQESGNEPAKTFKVTALRDRRIKWEAVCTKED